MVWLPGAGAVPAPGAGGHVPLLAGGGGQQGGGLGPASIETQIAARHRGILQPDIILFEWLSPFHTPTQKKLCITLTGWRPLNYVFISG